jgi:hypothetical protein
MKPPIAQRAFASYFSKPNDLSGLIRIRREIAFGTYRMIDGEYVVSGLQVENTRAVER